MERETVLLVLFGFVAVVFFQARLILRLFLYVAEHESRAAPDNTHTPIRIRMMRWNAILILVATFLIMVIGIALALEFDPGSNSVSIATSLHDVLASTSQSLMWRIGFVVEQVINGLAFDFFESYGLRLTDISYDTRDTLTATAVFMSRSIGQVYLTSVLTGLALLGSQSKG